MTYWSPEGYNLTGQQAWSAPTTFMGEYQSNLELRMSGFVSGINDESIIVSIEEIPVGSFVVRYESSSLTPTEDAQEILDVSVIRMITDVDSFMYKV